MVRDRRPYRYSEWLIMAVYYLIRFRGITDTREIAARLGVSPYTVQNVKVVLRKRGLLEPVADTPGAACLRMVKRREQIEKQIEEFIRRVFGLQ